MSLAATRLKNKQIGIDNSHNYAFIYRENKNFTEFCDELGIFEYSSSESECTFHRQGALKFIKNSNGRELLSFALTAVNILKNWQL